MKANKILGNIVFSKELFSVTSHGKVELPAIYLTPEVSNNQRDEAIDFIKVENERICFTGKSNGGLKSANEVKKLKAKDINDILIYLLEQANLGKYRKP